MLNRFLLKCNANIVCDISVVILVDSRYTLERDYTMAIVLRLLLPLLIFVALNFAVVAIFKEPFGYTLPISFMLCALTLYLSQYICGTFTIGYFVVYIGAIVSVIVFFLSAKSKDYRSLIFSNGLLCFLLIYFIFFFVDAERHFCE